jgi:hypothetical protein
VIGLNGKNYRLVKTNLEKDIIPSESKTVVKPDKVIVKLKKVTVSWLATMMWLVMVMWLVGPDR